MKRVEYTAKAIEDVVRLEDFIKEFDHSGSILRKFRQELETAVALIANEVGTLLDDGRALKTVHYHYIYLSAIFDESMLITDVFSEKENWVNLI
ncbi:MAG: hypothetical protein LBV19_01630 [Streptococcaceae bacterium]|nr:hypothetical protein [Streptococcaceae bacterium]